jgi:hypothetical protein
MPASTSPDGIVYPLPTDPIAPLNVVFQDLADSVQDALLPKVITSPVAGEKLVYDGSDWVNEEGYLLREVVTYTANGNFQKGNYPWLRAIRVICVGGGGGGAGVILTGATQMSIGNGGGGAVAAESFITDLSLLSAIETVTVGSRGFGGAGNAPGTAGGQTSLGSLVAANGGTGGTNSGAAVAGPLVRISDAAATSGTGDLIFPGSLGGFGIGVSNANTNTVKGGDGGPGYRESAGGIGGLGGTNGGAAPGTSYGAGGGGGANHSSQAARNGGAGCDGIVIVELYA